MPEPTCSILGTLCESICLGLQGRTSTIDPAKHTASVVCQRIVARPIADEGRVVMRILMAVDDSGSAEELLRGVVSGIRHENTEVMVLHVLQPVDTVPPP